MRRASRVDAEHVEASTSRDRDEREAFEQPFDELRAASRRHDLLRLSSFDKLRMTLTSSG